MNHGSMYLKGHSYIAKNQAVKRRIRTLLACRDSNVFCSTVATSEGIGSYE